jgi:hypothetical protein
MIIKITFLCAGLLLGSVYRSGSEGKSSQTSQSQDSNIKVMIEKLWSPERARLEAKKEIMTTGLAAAPSLMELLARLADEMDQPHFATGKEREAEIFLKDPSGHPDLAEFVITWRLILDCTELLSQMKCVEAVPLLIRVMESRESLNVFEKWSPEMFDLANMGAPCRV